MSLSIILPGSVMFSKEESLKQLKKPVKNKAGKVVTKNGKPVYKKQEVPDFDKHESFELRFSEGKGKKVETYKVFVRKNKPAKEVVNITIEGYNYMVSNETPYGYMGKWDRLTENQKLWWHGQRIAEQLGGILEGFQVFE